MMSKVLQNLQIIEPLTEKTWVGGRVVLVVTAKWLPWEQWFLHTGHYGPFEV